ncbi:MAG: carboxypeptidase regulatory-like domain-containing protein [Myxococcales bacterium]|nr:carboxypeptidase regulatory-like domain-containing protein [Myxococcales bacterium]
MVRVSPMIASTPIDTGSGSDLTSTSFVARIKLQSMRGTVVDEAGSVVPGALVTCPVDHERHTALDVRFHKVAVADEQGRFTLEGIPTGQTYRLLVQGEGGAEGLLSGVVAGDTVTIRLSLKRD